MKLTAKEYARDLVVQFRKHSRVNSSGFLVSNEDRLIESAKDCAKIAVKAIIKSNPTSPLSDDNLMLYGEMTDDAIEFYNQVLTEIDLL